MRTAPLGTLAVSVVGLGCNNFGRFVDAAGTDAVVGAALDAGVTLFDTADVYGEGRSEELLGMALAGRRDEAVLATKFGAAGGASPAAITRAIEQSLRALRTDRIDLYQLHRPDPGTPVEVTLEALDGLVRSGKVLQVGCSNLSADQLGEAARVSTARGLTPFVSTQAEYSLVARDPEQDGLLDACRRLHVGLLPYYPLASGLLTGKVRRGEEPAGRLRLDRYRRYLEHLDLAERLAGLAREEGHTLLELAVGWLLAQPQVASVIAGATTPEQVRANAAAAAWVPGPEVLAAVDALTEQAEPDGP